MKLQQSAKSHVAQFVHRLQAHEVATVGEDELQVRHALQHPRHGRHVHPPLVFPAIGVAVSIVHPESSCLARLLVDEPACGMSAQHQSVFIGGIVAEGIPHHLLHQLWVAGLHVTLAKAHIVERHRVCQLTVIDTCQPRLLPLHVTTHEDQQRVVADVH